MEQKLEIKVFTNVDVRSFLSSLECFRFKHGDKTEVTF